MRHALDYTCSMELVVLAALALAVAVDTLAMRAPGPPRADPVAKAIILGRRVRSRRR